MDIALAIIAFLLSLVGIIGCIVPVLPGLLLNFLALVGLYFTSYAEIDLTSLIIWLVVVAVLGGLTYALISTGSLKNLGEKIKRGANEITGGALGRKRKDK